jgi:hypothetical protein
MKTIEGIKYFYLMYNIFSFKLCYLNYVYLDIFKTLVYFKYPIIYCMQSYKIIKITDEFSSFVIIDGKYGIECIT